MQAKDLRPLAQEYNLNEGKVMELKETILLNKEKDPKPRDDEYIEEEKPRNAEPKKESKYAKYLEREREREEEIDYGEIDGGEEIFDNEQYKTSMPVKKRAPRKSAKGGGAKKKTPSKRKRKMDEEGGDEEEFYGNSIISLPSFEEEEVKPPKKNSPYKNSSISSSRNNNVSNNNNTNTNINNAYSNNLNRIPSKYSSYQSNNTPSVSNTFKSNNTNVNKNTNNFFKVPSSKTNLNRPTNINNFNNNNNNNNSNAPPNRIINQNLVKYLQKTTVQPSKSFPTKKTEPSAVKKNSKWSNYLTPKKDQSNEESFGPYSSLLRSGNNKEDNEDDSFNPYSSLFGNDNHEDNFQTVNNDDEDQPFQVEYYQDENDNYDEN